MAFSRPALATWWTLALVSAGGPATWAQPATAQRANAWNQQRLRFELAATQKTVADECFLRRDVECASEYYRRARSAAENVSPAPDVPQALVDLLRVDIDYRLLLLEHGVDFWGGALNVPPTNPVFHLKNLNRLHERLKDIAKDINDARNNESSDKVDRARFEALDAEAKGRGSIARVEGEKQQDLVQIHQRRVSAVKDRIDAVHILQAQQAAIAKEASAKLRELEGRANGAVLSGFSRAAGLPVDLGAVANGGSIKTQILGATASLVSSNAEWLSDLRIVSADLTKKIDALGTVATRAVAVGQLTLSKQPVDATRALIELGGPIVQTFAPDQAAALMSSVRNNSPVAALVQVAAVDGGVRNSLRDWLRQETGLQSADAVADIENGFARLISARQGAQNAVQSVFDNSLDRLSQNGLEQRALSQLTAMTVGSIAASDALTKTPLTSRDNGAVVSTAALPPSRQSNPSAQALNAFSGMAVGALSTAFPAVGVAATVVRALSDLYEMGVQIRRINAAREEIKRLVVEELHLQEVVEESRTNLAIAQYDQRIAILSSEAATEQREIYRRAIEALRQDMTTVQARVYLDAEVLLFVSEELRREFYRLNRSLSLWLGAARSPQGKIADLITSDPTYIRLALDPDIRVLEWIDSEAEGQRRDLDLLVSHWDKLVELSNAVCADYGCSQGATPRWELQATATRPVSQLVSADTWDAFRKWQESRPRRPFEFWILVHPAQRWISPTHYNARIVEPRLGAVTASGPKALRQFSLAHPGVSFISVESGYLRDVEPPDTTSSAKTPGTFDDGMLRNRWGDLRVPSKLEGYGLYTMWRLLLQPDDVNFEAKDFEIAFVYQFVAGDQAVLPDFSAWMRIAEGGTIPVSGQDLELLGTRAGLSSKLQRWRQAREGVPAVTVSIEVQ